VKKTKGVSVKKNSLFDDQREEFGNFWTKKKDGPNHPFLT